MASTTSAARKSRPDRRDRWPRCRRVRDGTAAKELMTVRADRPRVVVTGLGATTPLGGNVPDTWAAMLEGRSAAKRITEDWAARLPTRFPSPPAAHPAPALAPAPAPPP